MVKNASVRPQASLAAWLPKR